MSSNSYCFASVSISADVIFHNFLEFHSTLSEKGFFMNVLFINGFVYQPKYILTLFLLGQEINICLKLLINLNTEIPLHNASHIV